MSTSTSKRHLLRRLNVLGLTLVLIVVTTLDLWSKAWVQQHIHLGSSLTFLPQPPHWIQWTHVQNTGAAFSWFEGHPEILTLMTSAIFIALCLYVANQFMTQGPISRLMIFSYGLILGGGAGNLLERWTQGSVTDFIDVVAIHYPIFNIADSAVCIGMSIWCGVLLFKPTLILPASSNPQNEFAL